MKIINLDNGTDTIYLELDGDDKLELSILHAKGSYQVLLTKADAKKLGKALDFWRSNLPLDFCDPVTPIDLSAPIS